MPMRSSRELGDAFFVGATDDERAATVLEQFLEDHDLALGVDPTREHDVERLVEHHFLAALEAGGIDLGVNRDAHLAARGEHVDGAVVVGAEERAVARGRHRELLDLFPERRDVLAGLAEGGREAFVLGDGLGELALGLENPLLEGAHPLGGVLEAAAQDDDLLVERLELILEFADLLLVLSQASFVFAGHDEFLPTDHFSAGLAHPIQRQILESGFSSCSRGKLPIRELHRTLPSVRSSVRLIPRLIPGGA